MGWLANSQSDFRINFGLNFGPNFGPNFRLNFGLNLRPNFGLNFGENFGQSVLTCQLTYRFTCWITFSHCFLGGLSLHLNHLIASHVANYDWPFGTLPFGLFGSNLDTKDLDTYARTYSGHFWNMSIFDDSRAVWVLFRKWVVSENQSFLDEGAIVTPLSV